MHILLIGGGGREHAMAWKLAQSPAVSRLSVAPGNVGIGAEPKVTCVPIDSGDIDALLSFAERETVALTIVGPEAPLVAGIVDRFQNSGLRILGPSRAAAQLEGSKAFAKDFMQRHAIPTAAHNTFHRAEDALTWLDQCGVPIVIKADGLAAGKGVVVAHTMDEARNAVTDMLSDHRFGEAGATIVIEEFLAGEEASFIALVSGRQAIPFASSQDHKARDDGDAGPNTGGMGAYSPAPVVSESIHAHVMADIVQPTVNALHDDGTPFLGFLYVGLMIDEHGKARVVEYNVRLGDPETQPLLMRLDSDLLMLCQAAVDGQLDNTSIAWSQQSALGVVLAGGNYPAGSSHGEAISGIDAAEQLGAKVFHAGTRLDGEQLVTAGGRVLCVTALGDSIADAKRLADAGCEAVSWPNVHYRRDIGHRAIARRE